MKFAEAIKTELYGSGISYAEVASLLGIGRNTVRGWCKGAIVPTVEHCRDLDELLDKPCGYFEQIKRLDGDCYEAEWTDRRPIFATL